MDPNTSDIYPQSVTDQAARSEQVTLARLQDQISWYDRHSARNRIAYKAFKTLGIISAAAIPVLTTVGVPHPTMLASVLGVSIAVIEGIQQLNQCHANWAAYRTTAEALKREKYFYLGRAGPYLRAETPHALLAERVESLLVQVNSKWLVTQSQSTVGERVGDSR